LHFPQGGAKYTAKRRRAPSQVWKTFLRNRADGIAAMVPFASLSFPVDVAH
jgi:hypothetical protein